jgi:hypothetical protein
MWKSSSHQHFTYPQLAPNAHAQIGTSAQPIMFVGGNCQTKNLLTWGMVSRANPQGGMSQIGLDSQGGASLHIGELTGGYGQGWSSGRVGRNGESGKAAIMRQHGDWEHAEVLALISCKHVEQVVHRKLIDLCTHIVPSKQWWEKIVDELQKKIKSKFWKNNTMCKDKWNALNSIIKKLQIITKGLECIFIFGISCLNKKKGSIYLVYSTKSIMSWLMFFTDKMLTCMLGMWMLKGMWSTYHLHKKLRMKMKISISRIMFKKFKILMENKF